MTLTPPFPSQLQSHGTMIFSPSVSLRPQVICVFVEDGSRNGGFPSSLVEQHGFTDYGKLPGFQWSKDQFVGDTHPFLMYCVESDDVTLPATTTSETLHGICTK